MNKNCFYDPVNKIWSGLPLQPLYNVESNLGHTILQRLIQHPTNIFQISDDTGVELTNYEVYSRTLKIANHLTQLGVKQNDIVGLIALNRENIAPLMFACFAIGAAVNPLSVLMGEQDICYHWSKTKPKAVFCDPMVTSIVSTALNKMESNAKIYTFVERVNGYPLIDDIFSEDYNINNFSFPVLPNISTTNALIMCSSGTTGLPKGICKSHKQILTTFYLFFKRDPTIQDVAFCSVSPYWISHPSLLITSALYGMKFVITALPLAPDLWMDIIDRRKITVVFSVPAFIAVLLKSNKIRKFESLRVVIFAGCPIPQRFIDKVIPLVPNGVVYCAYGSTESDVITATSQDGPKGTSSGFPSKNVKIKIVDETGKRLGPNEAGEIRFQQAVPFPGYFKDPENNAQAFDSENFTKSGDVGYFDDEGHCYVVDRIKNLIKTKEGYRVTPAEIETIVDEIDCVLQSCVVGVEDQQEFIDYIYAFVVKNNSRKEVDEEYIVNYVNQQVVEVKKISGVIFVDKLPMTPTGKVIHMKLKDIAKKFHEHKVVEINY